ncbi:MAG: hypothetical protein HY360_22865 [Verrucomicrobia bacterium]|nr:hypothetical protein [Verrucomicrobiota bacterium]
MNPEPDNLRSYVSQTISRRRMLTAGIGAVGGGFLSAGCQPAPSPPPPKASREKASPFQINLGDYAKGDGSDETDAIQRAFNAIPPTDWKEHVTASHPGGVLFIPRPPVAYGISKTINVAERFNVTIRCESPAVGSRGMPANLYFRWIGPDNGVMFNFRSCHGMRVENLSMTGLDKAGLDPVAEKYKLKPIGRHTQGVTGILIGPVGAPQGFQKFMLFDNLVIGNVTTGIKFGDYANNGPDLVQFVLLNTLIREFSDVGVTANSGNLANVTFLGVTTMASEGARCNFFVGGGELLIMNLTDAGACRDASILLATGGVHVVKAWSETAAPFLKTGGGEPEWTEGTYGSVNYPIILEGVRHYDGGWMNTKVNLKQPNPVPLSVVYNRQVPLQLIGCSFWGGVELGEMCQATILDHGTIFVDKDCVGFTGPGVTRYGRVINLGTRHPKNSRILEPYVVDRRNTPGTEPPKKGVWQRGDGIINIEPDPRASEKAWRGWVCVEAGEPGKWVPYGALGK